MFTPDPKTIEETDVVIIGGGIVGLATAYDLAKRGKKVSLLEKHTFGWEGTARTAGGVRQRGRDPREMPLAIASVARWGNLSDELGASIDYRRGGNISVALDEEELEILQEASEQERSLGLDVKFLDRDELKKLVPALSDRCIGGNYCPTDGYAEPATVISAYVGALERLGVGLYPRTEALDFIVEDGHIISVLTKEIDFRPSVTVNATGPWAPILAMRVGVVLPIWSGRAQLVETEIVGSVFTQFLTFEGEQVYCRPTFDERIIYGSITWVTPASVEDPPTMVPAKLRAKGLASVIPALEGVAIHRTWSGLLDLTPDVVPILGRVSGLEDYIVAAGFSGHGYCLGPIIGKLLSELIVDGEPSLSLDAFSLSRFATELAF